MLTLPNIMLTLPNELIDFFEKILEFVAKNPVLTMALGILYLAIRISRK